jgi:hypothetical protein
MTIVEKRAVLEDLIECVFVEAGKRRPEDRLHVCLRGQAPADLPTYGSRRDLITRPFDSLGCATTSRLREEREWDEDELRETLAPFLAGRTHWPGFVEFQAAGLARAYVHVDRHGGHRRWAQLTGVPYRPRALYDWTEGRIRRELKSYLRGRSIWPLTAEFERDGRSALRTAIKFTGGPDRWAPELGIALPERRRRLQRWSYERIKTDMARFAAGRSEWPTRAQFLAAGLHPLYLAINAYQVRERLATELGLRLPPGRAVVRAHWTEPEIRAALDVFLKGRAKWPARAEFRKAGLRGLEARLDESGTRDLWQRRYGLQKRITRAEWAEQRRLAAAAYLASRSDGDQTP